MSTLSPLTNLLSSINLQSLSNSLLTITQPLPLCIACSIIPYFQTLKAENAALKTQLRDLQQEREALYEYVDEVETELADTLAEMPLGRRGSVVDRNLEESRGAEIEVAQEMELLMELSRGFERMVREVEQAVGDLPEQGDGSDEEDFGDIGDAVAGEIDADQLALMHKIEQEEAEKPVMLGASREVFEKLMSEAVGEGEVWVEASRKRKLSEAFPRLRCY